MAAYLQIHRGHLAMVEGGRRHLPAEKHIEVLTMYTEIDRLTKDIEETEAYRSLIAEEEATRHETARKYIKQTQLDIARLTYKLKAMEANFEKATKTLATLPALRQKITSANMNNVLPLLDMSEMNAKKALRANSLSEQYKLRVKIAGLEAAVKVHGEVVDG